MANYTPTQEDIDKLIDLYYKQPRILYEHLFSSYNQLVEEIIPYCLIKEPNYFHQNVVKDTIYYHGFKCSNIRIKPATFDNDNEIKFPSDARKNHLNYFATIVVDIVQILEKIDIITGEKTIKEIGEVEKETSLANIPIMVRSKYCSTQIKKDLHGECKYDPGGYFIVKGQEKVLISIEKMVDNKTLIFIKKEPSFLNTGGIIYNAHINSRKNDWSDNLQIVTIKNRKNNDLVLTSSTLIDVPIFVLFRAFGIESDRDIISKITYDLEDVEMSNLLRSSMDYSTDDNGVPIRTKEEAITYLSSKLRRNRMISQTDENLAKIQRKMFLEKILRQDFLPHLGEDIPKKIVYLGYMINKLLNVWLKRIDPDDRDALQNKRIETPGILIGQLFRQNWSKMLKEIGKLFIKKNTSDETPIYIINQIKPSVIEQGIKTGLATGIWGINKTKKGVSQALQRLSWIQAISYLRRIMTPSLESATSKVTSIRQGQNLQAQFLCLTGDTEILMGNGIDIKLMKDIINSDSVISINTKSLNQEPTFAYNKFGKMADKLLAIKTISGRVIKCTPEHEFLIAQNGKYIWKEANKLNSEDKLIIKHTEKYISSEKEMNIIINENEVLEQYKINLLENGYLNKKISLERLVIIARLLGALNINDKNKKDSYRSSFNLDEQIDVYQISDDILKLGFGVPCISRPNTRFVDKKSGRETLYQTWQVYKDGAFSYLLNFLKGFNNNKINQTKIVPDWIMNGNKIIKREYLSAFQGVNSSKISYQYNSTSKMYKFFLEPICLITTINLLDEYKKYLYQISKLFCDFDIKTTIKIENIKDNINKKKVLLIFENTSENIIKYSEWIGYRYCNEKTRKSRPIIEYLLIKKEDDYKNQLLEINIITQHKNNYEEFLRNNLLENDLISVNIKEVVEIPAEMVYDFTTLSENHNFIASSITTHNCICETPEGQKVGIVKSMAMMASISCQNSSQYEIVCAILKSLKIKHPADINSLQMKSFIKIFINGDWVGVCKLSEGNEITNHLKISKRKGLIDKYTTICLDYLKKEIKIYSDGGRLIRPIMIVSNNKLGITKELIDDVDRDLVAKDSDKGWKRLLSKYHDLVDYEDIESSNYIMCADRYYRLNESETNRNRKVENVDESKINRYGDYRWLKYSHCDFHAWTQLGIVAGNIPFSNHNNAGRNIIHYNQAKQSISIYLTSYKDRMDISQVLYYPQIPIVTTKTMEYNNCLDLPYGENAIVAIASYNGYNQEDSIIFNQSAIDRGIFRADTLKKHHSEIEKNPSTNQDDIFTRPDKNQVADMKQGNYSKLNDKGICPEETEIQYGDFIIGKISPIQPTGDNNKVHKDSSEIFKSNVNGVIDRVHTNIYNADGYEMYNVLVRMERVPEIGDKFSNRHGQKGTLGISLPQKDMPFTSEGLVPDIIMNPHSQPSRMTIGQLVECLASKIGAIDGTFIDGTPYCDYDVRKLPDVLEKLGYNKYGNEILYCGMTGKKIEAEIFMGPTYTVRLKHMTADKYHSRSRGPRQALTRQPLEGRSRDGGLKIGEMEKDAMIAHGMAQFLKERMMETSDITKVYICDDCGLFAAKVIDKDYHWCKACHNSNRISAVVMPYAAKLLFQELMSVNILPRIRTEKSIYADEA